jgi:hypothetical protein
MTTNIALLGGLLALSQVGADLTDGDADHLHGRAQLGLGAAELGAPERNFRWLAHADVRAVFGAI